MNAVDDAQGRWHCEVDTLHAVAKTTTINDLIIGHRRTAMVNTHTVTVDDINDLKRNSHLAAPRKGNTSIIMCGSIERRCR